MCPPGRAWGVSWFWDAHHVWRDRATARAVTTRLVACFFAAWKKQSCIGKICWDHRLAHYWGFLSEFVPPRFWIAFDKGSESAQLVRDAK